MTNEDQQGSMMILKRLMWNGLFFDEDYEETYSPVES